MSRWIAGADGCPSGWFRVVRDIRSGALNFALCPGASDLLTMRPVPVVLAIDIPIGLPDRGPRACDIKARQLLRPTRHASVFSAPIRPALAATSQSEASQITEAADGRRVSVQAWNIYKKVREVDALFNQTGCAAKILEVHPEVTFAAWSGAPMVDVKTSPTGRAARLRLAESWLGKGVLSNARGSFKKRDVADDDILDAVAALWTACRIHAGKAQFLQGHPSHDACGRPMRIAY